MTDLLQPQTPDDARVLFELFREELRRRLGLREEVPQLALLAARHIMGEEMLRLLLIGPPGAGKTFMARALGAVLDLPYLEMPVGSMAEEGWKGTSPSEHLSMLLARAATGLSTARSALRQAEQAVILLDELDKTRLPPPGGSAAGRENRFGRQVALLPIIGDGVVTIERGRGGPVQWRSRRALVICTGVFEELDAEIPSAGDLVDWGMLPELADRLAAGSLIRLREPTTVQLEEIVRVSLAPMQALFLRFGYYLAVSDATFAYVSNRLSAGHYEVGPRAAAGLLRAAAEEMLRRLLIARAPIGTRVVMGPDDVRMPHRPRGLWRE